MPPLAVVLTTKGCIPAGGKLEVVEAGELALVQPAIVPATLTINSTIPA